MPIIIACPSCGSKLRIADELCGQRVRCPTCNNIFDSTPASESRPLPQDFPLQLTIDEPSEPRPTSPGRAVEAGGELPLPYPLEDKQPPPVKQPSPLPELLDREDDYPPDIPDIRRRGPRRDAAPDRGAVVLTLGIISLACLMISCFPIGAILGLISWIMGSGDLHKMKRGEMDAHGQGMTQAGWICGIIGTLLNSLVTLGCLSFVGIIWYQENNRPLPPKPVPQWQQPKAKPPGGIR